MAKKQKYSESELRNDPSLKWCPYRRAEVVWSDAHQAEVRFMEYVGCDRARTATLNGIADMPGTVHRLGIRRPTALATAEELKPTYIGGTKWGTR